MTITYGLSKRGSDDLNSFFTRMYAYKSWLYRLTIFEDILDNTEDFFKRVDSDVIDPEERNTFILSVKGEIYFTFFHITEALFSMIFACHHAQVPWIQMKGLRYRVLCDFVRDQIVAKQFTDEQLRYVFFNGVIGDEAKKPEIIRSIEFLREYLAKMGELFLDNKAYGEYKHGLRVMTTQSRFQISPENVPNPKPILGREGTAVVYLDTKRIEKNGKDEVHQVKQITKSFDYQLYLRLGQINVDLLSNIFETRRQKEKLKPGDKMSIKVFKDCDLKEIFKEDHASKFSFTINHPIGDVPQDKHD